MAAQHKLLRGMFKQYRQIEAYYQATGRDTIDHVIDGEPVTVSYFDLKRALEDPSLLPARRRQALRLNLVDGLPQKQVANAMGIAPGSVGQHVDLACRQLVPFYFGP